MLAVKIGCSLSPTAKYSQSAKLIIGMAARFLFETPSKREMAVKESCAEARLVNRAGFSRIGPGF